MTVLWSNRLAGPIHSTRCTLSLPVPIRIGLIGIDARPARMRRMDGILIRGIQVSVQGSTDLIGSETAILKETGLLCTLGRAAGPGAKFSLPHLRRQPPPVPLAAIVARQRSGLCLWQVAKSILVFADGRRQVVEFLLDPGIRDALLPQLGAYSHRPLPAHGSVTNETGDEPIIGYQALAAQLLDHRRHDIARMPLALELTLEFLGGMFASGQQPNGRQLDALENVLGTTRQLHP